MRIIVIATVLAFLLYGGGMMAPFYLDDTSVIDTAQGWNWHITRPAGFLSFWLNARGAEVMREVLPLPEPTYYRFVNIVMHGLTASALFWLMLELQAGVLPAGIGAAIFLAHPIQTQAVTYITQRFESQAALFLFLSVAAYIRWRRIQPQYTTIEDDSDICGRGTIIAVDRHRRWPWLLLSATCGITAIGTKETALVLPLWLALIEVVFLGTSWRRAVAVAAVVTGFGALALRPAILNMIEGPTVKWIAWQDYVAAQGEILPRYIGMTLWPNHQYLFHGAPPILDGLTILGWLFILSIIMNVIRSFQSQPLIGFGILSFFLLLLPVSLIPLPDLINEHRLYPAMAGVAMIAAGLYRVINRRSALAVAAVIVLLLGVRTYQRNAEWNDPMAFLELNRQAFPHDALLLHHLSTQYAARRNFHDGLRVALDARREEGSVNVYYRQKLMTVNAVNLSSIYLATGQAEKAKWEARRAIAANPKESVAWSNLFLAEPSSLALQKFNELKPPEPQERQPAPAIPQRYQPYVLFAILASVIAGGTSLWIRNR